jgi:hypothetical protein
MSSSSPNHPVPTKTNNIQIKRSDGLKHDILNVFKNPKEFFGGKKMAEVIEKKDSNDHHDDHGVIKLHRFVIIITL